MLDLSEHSLFFLEQKVSGPLDTVLVNTNTFPSHIYEDGQNIELQINHTPEIFLGNERFEEVPQLQCELGIHFGVWSDMHTWQFPELGFGIDTEISSSFSQVLLTFCF